MAAAGGDGEHDMYATPSWSRCWLQRRGCCRPSQVHRLVTSTPERLPLTILAALRHLTVEPSDLIITNATSVGVHSHRRGRPQLGQPRPRRARSPTPNHRGQPSPRGRLPARRTRREAAPPGAVVRCGSPTRNQHHPIREAGYGWRSERPEGGSARAASRRPRNLRNLR
jgi:hypothetical protein